MFKDMGYLISNYYQFYLIGIASTLLLAIVGTGVGLLLGILLAFGKICKPSHRDPWYKKLYRYPLYWFANIYSIFVRGTPMMVQAMIFKYSCQYFGVNWNLILPGVPVLDGWMIAGLIVITLNTAAYMGEIVKAGLNGVDVGQVEGAKSLGMNKFQTLIYVTLPQALKNSIPTIGNEWIVNIKDSSVLNVIGVTELYFQSADAASENFMFVATYVIVALIYLTLTLCSTGILKLIENKLNGRKFKFSFFHYNAKRV